MPRLSIKHIALALLMTATSTLVILKWGGITFRPTQVDQPGELLSDWVSATKTKPTYPTTSEEAAVVPAAWAGTTGNGIAPPETDFCAGLEEQRQAFEKMLAAHPYANRPFRSREAWKQIPKQDRPDLAAELDFLLTLDPATGQVPVERKYLANEAASRGFLLYKAIENVSWVERGPNNVAGRTRAVAFDPNDPSASKVWAGGVGGGLWYTDNIFGASPNWIHVDGFWDNIAISSIAFNPANTQEIYVGTGEGWFNSDAQKGGGMWKSSNGGTTWNRLPSTDPGAFDSNSNWQYINKIVIKNNGTIFAATRTFYTNVGGIMRSTDGGATWTRVLSVRSGGTTPPDRGADLEIAANGDVYATFGVFSAGKVFKSLHAENGASGTWTDLSDNIGIANGQRIELACAPSNANIIYAVASGGAGGNDVAWFKKSVDGGTNWTNLTIPLYREQDCSVGTRHFTRGQAWYDLILAIHPTNPNLVIAGGIDLHRTTDGGTTWQDISYWTGNCLPYVHADQHTIKFRPGASNEIIVGTDGGVHYSSNAGNASATPTFTEKNTGYNITQFYACATKNELNSNYFLAGSQDNGTQKFTQPQLGSTQQITGGDGGFCHIDQENSNIQITSLVFNSYFRSLNGGNTFDRFFNNQTSGLFINPTDYDSQRKILYCAANADSLRRISGLDGTITETLFYHDFNNLRLTSLKISPFNDVLFVGTMGGRIFKVNNASATPTFTRIDNGASPITSAGAVSCIEVGADDNHLLITFSNYGVNSVWETTDGGANWYSKEGNLPDIPIRWALFNPENRNEVLLATEVGIWSTNGFGTGTNSVPDWSPSSTNLANTRCTMLRYRPADKMVVVSTHGRGLFTSDVFVSNAVADFTADTKSTCNGSLTVQFADASLKATSWAWDVDNDGITDYTIQNPIHTYSTDGIYSVSLTVNQGESTETKKDYIIVQNTSPAATTVCTNTLNLNNIAGIGIFWVKLANIDHTTPHNDGAYNDYSCSQTTQLFPNTLYQITIRTGQFNDEGAAVYIDYNDNGTFEVGELVTSFPANMEGERTGSFTTPTTVVKNKLLRMRVVSKFEAIPEGACDVGDYGQAEDYGVIFTDTHLWTAPSDGINCIDGSTVSYNPANSVFSVTSKNCYYANPFNSDATALAQRTLCGNGSITAQVTSISGGLGWAGIVMRESNMAGAKKAQLMTNLSNFSRREFRTTTGGSAYPQQFPSQNRRWLRIVRSGNQFVMYVSPNGVNWAFAGAQTIQMNSCIDIGLVVTNYSSNSTVTATFANVSVTGGNGLPPGSDDNLESLANFDDRQGLREVKVYPNPTSGQLNIALTGYVGLPVTLEVYNTVGQILYTRKVDEVQNSDEIIDLSSVANGMYLIRVSSDGLPAEMKRVTVAR